MAFIYKFASAESKWDVPEKKNPSTIDHIKTGYFIFAELSDLLKGWLYLIYAPHTTFATWVLICSLVLPFSFCWISVQLRHIEHDDEKFEKEETLFEIA